MNITQDDVDEAKENLQTIKDLISDLDSFFRQAGRQTFERWKAYPKGHITMALSKDHDFVGDDMFNVEDLIDEVESDLEPEEDDEDEETEGEQKA